MRPLSWDCGAAGSTSSAIAVAMSLALRAAAAPRRCAGARRPRRRRARAPTPSSTAPAGRRRAPSRAGRRARAGAKRTGGWDSDVGLGVDEQAHDLQRRDPVDQRVVDLAEHADAAVRQPRDEEDLPQRPRAIQRRRQHRRAQRLERRLADGVVGAGERDEVRARGRSSRRRSSAARSARAASRPAASDTTGPRAARPAARSRSASIVGRGRPLGRGEHRAPADVHRRLLGVQAQERAVERRQAAGGLRGRGHAAPPRPAALSTADRFS